MMHASPNTILALLLCVNLKLIYAQMSGQPAPTYNNYTCMANQTVVYGEQFWTIPNGTFPTAVTFISNFCGASIGNTSLNCTGSGLLGSTRKVRQANGNYIKETLLNLTVRPYDGMLEQTVTSVEANTIDMSTFNYTDYSHLSVIQVYKQNGSAIPQMKMWTNRCVNNATQGNISVAALLQKAEAYYVAAISNATASA